MSRSKCRHKMQVVSFTIRPFYLRETSPPTRLHWVRGLVDSRESRPGDEERENCASAGNRTPRPCNN